MLHFMRCVPPSPPQGYAYAATSGSGPEVMKGWHGLRAFLTGVLDTSLATRIKHNHIVSARLSFLLFCRLLFLQCIHSLKEERC